MEISKPIIIIIIVIRILQIEIIEDENKIANLIQRAFKAPRAFKIPP